MGMCQQEVYIISMESEENIMAGAFLLVSNSRAREHALCGALARELWTHALAAKSVRQAPSYIHCSISIHVQK